MSDNLFDIAEATMASKHRVVKVVWQGKSVWVKKASAEKAVFLPWLQNLFAVLLKKEALRPTSCKGGAAGLKQEAEHIAQFRAAGFAVPEVLALSDRWIALEDIGMIIDTELKTTPDMNAQKLKSVLAQCAAEIARLHNAGLTHGRCKLNDLVRLENGGIGFIDFEESAFDTKLYVWQARELLYFSMSVARYLPVSADAVLAAIEVYRQKSVHPEIFAEFLVLVKSLRVPMNILRPCAKILGGDVARSCAATAQLLRLAENRG